jgi:hypothetical protein
MIGGSSFMGMRTRMILPNAPAQARRAKNVGLPTEVRTPALPAAGWFGEMGGVIAKESRMGG